MNTKLSYINVLKPGISSIQDAGRFGYLSEGIPMAGFMDSRAAGLANMLVGNSSSTACIEWAMLPPSLVFENAAIIALTGAVAKVYLNGNEIFMCKRINVPKNTVLSFGRVESGIYGYVAIYKGFHTDKILGSRSWFPQLTTQYLFSKGLKIPFFSQDEFEFSKARIVPQKQIQSTLVLEVNKGPEFNLLTEKQQLLLINSKFTIGSNRNRMGIQLNEVFENHSFSLLSSPVLPGTVQWTPSGKLIVLMKDAQTIGGYPRILQLTESALIGIANHGFNIAFTIKP